MHARALPVADGGDRGAADHDGWETTDAAFHSLQRPQTQAEQPIERHKPLPDDKVALFALPAIHRLVGTWQGPGTITQLRRRRP
jgi:hypothetical protein